MWSKVNIASDIVDNVDSDDEAGITLCVYVTIGGGGGLSM